MMISASPPIAWPSMTGSESAPDTSLPQAVEVSREQALNGLNPLQHVPILGTIYRAATGEEIPTTMRVAGAGLFGGPLGVIGAGFMSLLEALVKMGPDTSRPAVPVGMAQTGSEAGVEAVTPGTMQEGGYVTLATVMPDFLRPTSNQAPGQAPDQAPNTAIVQNGAAAYQSAAMEWRRAEMVEKGLA